MKLSENERAETKTSKDSFATHLYLLRHAPTYWNKERRLQGRVDTDVIPEGVERYLSSLPINSIPRPDVIVVSALKRTRQTAKVLMSMRGWQDIKIVENANFNERNWGDLEGKKHEEVVGILEQDSQVFIDHPDLHKLSDLAPIIDAPGFAAKNGETMAEVTVRIKQALEDIHTIYPGKTLVLIVHIGVLLSQGLSGKEVSHVVIKKDTIRFEKVRLVGK